MPTKRSQAKVAAASPGNETQQAVYGGVALAEELAPRDSEPLALDAISGSTETIAPGGYAALDERSGAR